MGIAEVIPRSQWTLEEFYQIPEGPPYYEYEEGDLIEMNRPTPRHQRVLQEIGMEVGLYLRENPQGRLFLEVNVELLGRKVYTPDLVFISQEEVGSVDEMDVIRVPPTMIGEILSPSTAGRDQVTKLNTYAEAGVDWYWLIDPEALTIIEFRLAEHGHYAIHAGVERGQVFRPGLFPGLEIDLCRLLD
jgi:Uma2 family endonuclease